MLNSLVATIHKTTDFRYNLLLTYGIFLQDVPKRLGINEALDASVAALVTAHAGACSRRGEVSPRAISKYSHAMTTLRTCLDQPVKARAAETLCAVMILLICQVGLSALGPASV